MVAYLLGTLTMPWSMRASAPILDLAPTLSCSKTLRCSSRLPLCLNQVDVDFVRRSVRAIGRAAIKLERAAERCINVLLELIHTKVNYVVQEAIIVIKDIFRR